MRFAAIIIQVKSRKSKFLSTYLLDMDLCNRRSFISKRNTPQLAARRRRFFTFGQVSSILAESMRKAWHVASLYLSITGEI